MYSLDYRLSTIFSLIKQLFSRITVLRILVVSRRHLNSLNVSRRHLNSLNVLYDNSWVNYFNRMSLFFFFIPFMFTLRQILPTWWFLKTLEFYFPGFNADVKRGRGGEREGEAVGREKREKERMKMNHFFCSLKSLGISFNWTMLLSSFSKPVTLAQKFNAVIALTWITCQSPEASWMESVYQNYVCSK